MYKAQFVKTKGKYKAQFVKENGKFKDLFVLNRANYLNKLFLSIYEQRFKRSFNLIKSLIVKYFLVVDWKEISVDSLTFIANSFLEGIAINFVTFIVFKDSLSFGRMMAYGLVPNLLEYYFLRLKNGSNKTISKDKPSYK